MEYKKPKSFYNDFVTLSKTVTTLSTSSRVNSQFTAMRMLQQQAHIKQYQIIMHVQTNTISNLH